MKEILFDDMFWGGMPVRNLPDHAKFLRHYELLEQEELGNPLLLHKNKLWNGGLRMRVAIEKGYDGIDCIICETKEKFDKLQLIQWGDASNHFITEKCMEPQEYKEDTRENKIIYDSFSKQINCIIDFVDFIYLDVISSGREIAIATEIIEKFNKPILVGIHLSKNGRLPSGEKIEEVINKYKSSSWAGILSSCVSMEIAEASINELKIHDLPFGYKVNLWGNEEPLPIRKINIAKFNENAVNLNTIMGKRLIEDDIYKKLGQKFIDNGATILGGCCETSPKHTKILSMLR